MGIDRIHTKRKLTIVASTCESEVVKMQPFVMAALHIPSAWTAAAIAFKSSPTEDGTCQPVYDDNGSLLRCSSLAADQVITAPPEVANLGYVKLWSEDGSEGDVNQGADREIYVDLKG